MKRLMLILIISSFLFQFVNLYAEVEVPAWVKEAVWYQIFPERFRNGDPANDPKLEDIIGAWPFNDTSEFNIVPWTADWYKLQPWEDNGKGFYYHAQRRRFGGDLQGVFDKLDYIQELGVTAIYFNPVFESPSLHKYDGSMYHHIDDNFGPDPAGDKEIINQETADDPSTWQWTSADRLFLKLVSECHTRNIRVIIDGVFNHVGLNFFAFLDLKKNQQQSRYRDWFTVKKWDNPQTKADELEYECWSNVKSMPEIREREQHGFQDDAWRYMEASIRRWMDPNGDGDPEDGIDGWRLDVAEKVTTASWRKFRSLTRTINPESYTVAEVWWEDWPHKMFNAAPWLQGDMFDAVMNYRFAAATTQFFIDQNNRISVSEFDKKLRTVRTDYPTEANYVLLNLMNSHDTDRLASMIMNPDRIYGHNNTLNANRDYIVDKPQPEHIKKQKLILLFQMTYVGAPCIFYGDEAGMWGASDPDERKPMLWPDLNYEDEQSHPFGRARHRDKNEFNKELFEYYQQVISLRKSHPALKLGDFATLITDDVKSVFGYQRTYNNDTVIVLLNNSDEAAAIEISLDSNKIWQDCLTGQQIKISGDPFTVAIPATAGVVMANQSGK